MKFINHGLLRTDGAFKPLEEFIPHGLAYRRFHCKISGSYSCHIPGLILKSARFIEIVVCTKEDQADENTKTNNQQGFSSFQSHIRVILNTEVLRVEDGSLV